MANGILKGLAVAAGTGLAMGLTSGRVRVRSGPRRPEQAREANSPIPPASEQDDEFLDIEPLLDRLERLEARVESIELNPRELPGDYAVSVADLDRRVEENTRELALLRESITGAEQRMNEAVASVERKVEQTREEMPAFVEQHVAARIDDLQTRFTLEIEQAHQRTLETFERAIDQKIASRIGSIEKALGEQAGSIEALSKRAAETDNNLQRLVAAIERLCERAQLIPPAPELNVARGPIQPPAQHEARLPFEAQLNDAMGRAPVVPVLRNEEPAPEVQVAPPAFPVNEPRAPKKSRFLFRSLLAAGFSLLASRFLR